MGYTVDSRGITPSLLNPKPKYSVSVHLKNEFSALTVVPLSQVYITLSLVPLDSQQAFLKLLVCCLYILLKYQNPIRSQRFYPGKHHCY